MAAAVSGQEDHRPSGQLAGQKTVRRRAKWRPDLHPFLAREIFEVIEAAAADDADAMRCHAFPKRSDSLPQNLSASQPQSMRSVRRPGAQRFRLFRSRRIKPGALLSSRALRQGTGRAPSLPLRSMPSFAAICNRAIKLETETAFNQLIFKVSQVYSKTIKLDTENHFPTPPRSEADNKVGNCPARVSA